MVDYSYDRNADFINGTDRMKEEVTFGYFIDKNVSDKMEEPGDEQNAVFADGSMQENTYVGDNMVYSTGPKGDFVYDKTQFEWAPYMNKNSVTGGYEREECFRYKGSETDGDKIEIPEGIRDMSHGFDGNMNISSIPALPDSLEKANGMFRGCMFMKGPSSLARQPDGTMLTPPRLREGKGMFQGCVALEQGFDGEGSYDHMAVNSMKFAGIYARTEVTKEGRAPERDEGDILPSIPVFLRDAAVEKPVHFDYGSLPARPLGSGRDAYDRTLAAASYSGASKDIPSVPQSFKQVSKGLGDHQKAAKELADKRAAVFADQDDIIAALDRPATKKPQAEHSDYGKKADRLLASLGVGGRDMEYQI